MYKVVILPDAKKDIFDTALRYEEKSYGLGELFKKSIAIQIDKLQSNIIEHSTVYAG